MIIVSNEEPTPTPIDTTLNDSDHDGIADKFDSYPNDPKNGLTYKVDPPTTYTLPSVPRGSTLYPNPGGSQTYVTPLPCMKGYGLDTDKDGTPDHCDPVYNSPDSDGDGLYDYEDAYPYNKDRDNDGIWDGQDKDPNDSKYQQEKRERERLEAKRLEEKRLEERRLEEERQRQRQNTPTYGAAAASYEPFFITGVDATTGQKTRFKVSV